MTDRERELKDLQRIVDKINYSIIQYNETKDSFWLKGAKAYFEMFDHEIEIMKKYGHLMGISESDITQAKQLYHDYSFLKGVK